MVILGMLLIFLGILAILAAAFVSEGSTELLGIDMNAFAIFLVGVTAGAFILWGFGILKYGTKKGLAQRREQKKITELSDKLDRVEHERHPDGRPTDEPRA